MINVDKVSEDIDYKLIPAVGSENAQAWDVRILTGDFTETVIRFGNVSFNGKNDCLNFNFKVISSPDPELNVTHIPLQDHAALILEDVMEKSIGNGSIVLKDMEEND